MASTKIINVARDDRFEEILSLFESTSAGEVIFVLPKNAKAFNRESNLVSLRDAAQAGGKKISLLCPNPRVVALASAYGFEILPDKASTPRPKKAKVQLAQAVPLDDDSFDRVRDESDADVAVPSDEAIPLKPDDELEGMHEEDEHAKDVNETLTGEEDALVEEPTEEQLGGIEEESADDIASGSETPVASLASARRQLDGVAAMGHHSKTVAPHAQHERRNTIPVHNQKQYQRRMADIAQVWQSEQQGTNMWTDIPHTSQSRLASFRMNWSKRLGVVGGIFALVGVGTLVYFITGSAQVFVTPASRDLDLAIHATISDRISEVDAASKRLPGQVFTVEKTVSQEFPASGEKDVAQKARGKVTVTNALTAAQTLIATTRFESADGHIFRSLRSVNVPSATVKSGVSTPGSMEVEVIADKPGKEYNVAAGTFTVPAFKEKGDTERYSKVKAQSSAAFTGGINGKAKVVTEVDYQTARETVSAEARSAVLTALTAEIGTLLAPKPSTIVKAVEASAQVDQAVDSFTVSSTGAIKTVGIKKEDLEKLVAEAIAHDQHLTVIPDKLEITIGEGQFSETSGMYEVNLSVKGKGYDMLDKEKLVGDLMGRNETDIRTYLKSAPGVASARVVLSPFWVRKMPKNKEKVTLEFQYE